MDMKKKNLHFFSNAAMAFTCNEEDMLWENFPDLMSIHIQLCDKFKSKEIYLELMCDTEKSRDIQLLRQLQAEYDQITNSINTLKMRWEELKNKYNDDLPKSLLEWSWELNGSCEIEDRSRLVNVSCVV